MWSKWVYVAPASAGEDEIVVSLSSDCYCFKYNIHEPTGHEVLNAVEVNFGEKGLSGKYYLDFIYKIAPTNVSFAAVDVMEIGMISTNNKGVVK